MTVTFPADLGLSDQIVENPMEVPVTGDVIVTEKGNFGVTRRVWDFSQMTVLVFAG